MVEQYSLLAEIYSHLMEKVNYADWAEYIYDIALFENIELGNVLEIAGGNGKLANSLFDLADFYILTDKSLQMLKTSDNIKIPMVCCDMRHLPFEGKFDLIFSTFDSVNYLMTDEDFVKFLKEAKNLLAPNGILTFDVSLEKNSLKFLRYLNRKGRFKGIIYKQISKYDREKRIHMNKFIFKLPDGREIEETHKQRIYRFNDYFKFFDEAGLFAAECFNSFTFEDANDLTERAQFILKIKR